MSQAVRVCLPGALRPYAGGQREVPVELTAGLGTVGDALRVVGERYPGVRQRVLDDQGALRQHVNVFLNGDSVRHLDGLATAVTAGDELFVIPAISGGARAR